MNATARAFPRHRFTLDDVSAMIDAGVLGPDPSVELIDGELIDMPADGPRHIDWTYAVSAWLFQTIGRDYVIVAGQTLKLSDHDGPKPDWWVFPAALDTATVGGPDVLLAVEVSDSSVERDLGWKADLYARFGVRDYWVVDAPRRRLFVHREPAGERYASVQEYDDKTAVQATLLPGLTLRLTDLPRVG